MVDAHGLMHADAMKSTDDFIIECTVDGRGSTAAAALGTTTSLMGEIAGAGDTCLTSMLAPSHGPPSRGGGSFAGRVDAERDRTDRLTPSEVST